MLIRGVAGKTLEAQGDPFRRGLPTLQTSLTHPELPPRAPAFAKRRFVSLCFGRVLLGEVFCWFGRCGFGARFGYRACLRCGALSLYCRERPMCRSASGESYLLTTVQCHTRVPRFRLPAPLRGSTPRQLLVYMFAVAPLCRSAQNDTVGVAFCKM